MGIRDGLIGKQIGDWYVRGLAQRYNHVICQCSCGTIKEVSDTALNYFWVGAGNKVISRYAAQKHKL